MTATFVLGAGNNYKKVNTEFLTKAKQRKLHEHK